MEPNENGWLRVVVAFALVLIGTLVAAATNGGAA